jgi:hypothetical protein
VPVLHRGIFLAAVRNSNERLGRASALIFGDLRQCDARLYGFPLGAGDPKRTKADARPSRGQNREQEAENKGQKDEGALRLSFAI